MSRAQPTPGTLWRLSDFNRKSRLLKPFVRRQPAPTSREHMQALAASAGITMEAMEREMADQGRWPMYRNGDAPWDYQVEVRAGPTSEEVAQTTAGQFPEVVWLSIKRVDKDTIHDWRHLQEIKNMIVGPEHEAVELYPAESRVVDSANQYHLWVLRDPAMRFPFGFDRRFVSYEPEVGGARQRPRRV